LVQLRAVNSVVLEYPQTWLDATGTSAEDFARDVRLAAAMKLVEAGKLTSGQAARLAGVPRREFLLICHQWGVDTVSWDEEEIRRELGTPVDFGG
jgi:predicted HTH domain antitoxin